jgi:hypothetical protein
MHDPASRITIPLPAVEERTTGGETAMPESQASRDLRPASLAGFTLSARFTRAADPVGMTLEPDGAPGTAITIDSDELTRADPVGLITESRAADALSQ